MHHLSLKCESRIWPEGPGILPWINISGNEVCRLRSGKGDLDQRSELYCVCLYASLCLLPSSFFPSMLALPSSLFGQC